MAPGTASNGGERGHFSPGGIDRGEMVTREEPKNMGKHWQSKHGGRRTLFAGWHQPGAHGHQERAKSFGNHRKSEHSWERTLFVGRGDMAIRRASKALESNGKPFRLFFGLS